jgi:hypothetical protein
MNSWHPLPRDYPDLTVEGQREARIAAVTKQDTPMELVGAWDLFRRLYLLPTEPGFFYHNFAPSPPFHYQAIHDLGQYARNILVAPRGFSKSTVIGTEVLLFLLLTRQYIRLALALATDKMIEARFDTIIKQLVENPYILEDFGVQKPKRGEAIWNRHHISLKGTGSKLEGFSVTGRKRGARPDLIILDDPEYDPESESATSALMLKEKFETLLFRQILPMLEKGSGIFWIGTMISRRSFLYHACYGEDNRFQFWNRRILKSMGEGEEEDGTSLLWESKYDGVFLAAKKKEMGPAAFMAEFQNSPVSEQERVLKVDKKKNEYSIKEFTDTDPLESTSPVSFHKFNRDEKTWVPTSEPLGKLVSGMFRFITVDSAEGLGQHNDYSCIAVMGVDKSNCLWILDMWMGRVKDLILLNKIYSMGLHWQPRIVGIEAVTHRITVVDSMSTLLEERKEGGWCPRLLPIDYKNVKGEKNKPSRIATLEWRFQNGKIKYPAHLKNKWPFNALYSQTTDFTYDLALLPFDDAIDTVAMSSFVTHGRGVRGPESVPDLSLMERLKKGELRMAGVPIISGINSSEIDEETFRVLVDKDRRMRYNKKQGDGDPIAFGPRERPPFRIRRPRMRGVPVR